jgi:hypothetical protein
MPTSADSRLELFLPLLQAAEGLDLTVPIEAQVELNKRYPVDGAAADALRSTLSDWLKEGEICERGELPMRFGRVTKQTPESLDFSIDVVQMNGEGPRHKHPKGEVNFCIATDGDPKFDGQGPGWVVFPPESQHVPTVSGGTMLIVYLLPSGAMEFLKDA